MGTTPPEPDAPYLVIGYGNTLRSDDGAGPRAAAEVGAWGVPGLRAWAVHQLTPELASPIASARLVVFVDARLVGPEGPRVDATTIAPGSAPGLGLGHLGDPRGLL